MLLVTPLLLVILFFSNCSQLKEEKKHDYTPIFLKEYSIYFEPDSCICKMKVDLDVSSKGKLMIDLFDCKGRMNFQCFDSTNKLIVEGSYINSLDTLKKYSIGRSAITDESKVDILSYFEPLPDGLWSYYKNGKKIKNVMFEKGILKNNK